MIYRTDLALEKTEPQRHVRREQDGCVVTRIEEDGARSVTIEVSAISDHLDSDHGVLRLIVEELGGLLPEEGPVLVAGLGNRAITPDAIGPLTAEKVLATRHIQGEIARVSGLSDLRPVSVASPGVLGCTGIEAVELLMALVQKVKPAAVIAVDALAARSPARLGCTVQLSSGGISPGSGVGNARPRIDTATLGIPVVGLGIPTVVDAATLAADLLGEEDATALERVEPRGAPMMVTPREIDLIISRGARLLSMGVNLTLNPSLSLEDFEELT